MFISKKKYVLLVFFQCELFMCVSEENVCTVPHNVYHSVSCYMNSEEYSYKMVFSDNSSDICNGLSWNSCSRSDHYKDNIPQELIQLARMPHPNYPDVFLLNFLYKYPKPPFDLKISMGQKETINNCLHVSNISSWNMNKSYFSSFIIPSFSDYAGSVFLCVKVEIKENITQKLVYQKIMFHQNQSIAMFSYKDCTTIDQIHISYITSSKCNVTYDVLNEKGTNLIKTVKLTNESKLDLETSNCSSYVIIEKLDEDEHNICIYWITGLSLLFLLTPVVTILFFSRITVKNIILLNCPCAKHESHYRIITVFKTFLEDCCSVKVNRGIPSKFDTGSAQNILMTPESTHDCILVYIPSPYATDHHPEDAQIEDCANNYRNVKKKAVIQMPWKNDGLQIWGRNEFKYFALMQEFPMFVKFLHPRYYPRFLERILRPKLEISFLEEARKNRTLDNSAICAVIDLAANHSSNYNI